uniref:carboxypeptidase-like regulatory domain-containing protein n=1 Tax=uncultured Parabacteroides sp. TaxID=512312 RepID=UPI0025D70DF2
MNKINYLCLLLILLLFPFASVSAQEVNISGVVIDNEGLTMPGVSVAVKGATSGTITDLDGKFNISVPKGTTLIFS